MLAKIKTVLILILMGAIAFLLFQGSTFLDSKLENKPSPWVQEVPDTVAPASRSDEDIQRDTVIDEARAYATELTQKALDILDVDAESPEIDNSDYGWLQGRVDNCHPSMKSELRSAMNNDGVIRKNEYRAIMNRCVEFNEQESVGEKDELRRFLAQ